jgi:hypothetical protein
MSAFDPKRTFVGVEAGPKKLSEFDDFGLALAARLTLEHTLVVVCIVGLDAGQPHRRAARGASWMFDFEV